MHRGRIEQKGTPQEVYSRPRSVFAADFMGGANILELDVLGQEGQVLARFGDGQTVPLEGVGDAPTGRSHFMLRKEAIRFDPPAGFASVECSVVTRNYLGSQARSVLAIGGTELVAVTDPATGGQRGEKLRAGWRPADLIRLDRE